MSGTGMLPRHVAIIMDGNGRWAAARRLLRARGHAEGIESVRAVTRHCARRKLQQLTLYAFSEPFQIRRGETFRIGDLIITDTPPPFPESIRITGGENLLSVDETTQLVVTGTKEDGKSVDVTLRTTLTVYRTSNPAVAMVGENGLVTAHGVGDVFITAVNEGATAVKKMTVTSAVKTTTVEGFVQLQNGTSVAGASVSTPFSDTAPFQPHHGQVFSGHGPGLAKGEKVQIFIPLSPAAARKGIKCARNYRTTG